MAGFGAELRAEREGRGLTLDVLSSRTKVNPRHLEALEQDNFLALPGGVFRKGIVRAYLAAVGLSEEFWMPRFQASFVAVSGGTQGAAQAEQDAWVIFATNVRRSRGTKRERVDLRWLGVLALFVSLALAAWVVWRSIGPEVARRTLEERTGRIAFPHLRP